VGETELVPDNCTCSSVQFLCRVYDEHIIFESPMTSLRSQNTT